MATFLKTPQITSVVTNQVQCRGSAFTSSQNSKAVVRSPSKVLPAGVQVCYGLRSWASCFQLPARCTTPADRFWAAS